MQVNQEEKIKGKLEEEKQLRNCISWQQNFSFWCDIHAHDLESGRIVLLGIFERLIS